MLGHNFNFFALHEDRRVSFEEAPSIRSLRMIIIQNFVRLVIPSSCSPTTTIIMLEVHLTELLACYAFNGTVSASDIFDPVQSSDLVLWISAATISCLCKIEATKRKMEHMANMAYMGNESTL